MNTKIKKYYNTLGPNKRLAIHFSIQWLYWFIMWWVKDLVWPSDNPETISSLIYLATWMATCMTCLFEWKKVKALFTRKKIDGK